MLHSDDAYTPEELAGQAKIDARRLDREQRAPKPPTEVTTSVGRRKYKKGLVKHTTPPAMTVYNPYSLLAEKPKVKPEVNPASYISLEVYEQQQEVEANYRQSQG